MNDLRTAAQQLLEACEQRLPLKGQAAIMDELNALRAALEQQAEQTWVCPDSPEHRYAKPGHCEDCGKTLVQEQGCDHCNHPLYAATRCRVCGRVTEQAEPDHETRAELAEQQVVQLAEERDHYRNLWQKAQQAEPVACCDLEERKALSSVKLPCDVRIGHGTHRKGSSLLALVVRSRSLYQMAKSDAYGYASRLAVAIWEKHYKDTAPHWKPLDDLVGVLTQIDNMAAGMTRLAQQAEPVEPVAVVRTVVGPGDDGVRIKWLRGFPQIGDRLYAGPVRAEPLTEPPCHYPDCTGGQIGMVCHAACPRPENPNFG